MLKNFAERPYCLCCGRNVAPSLRSARIVDATHWTGSRGRNKSVWTLRSVGLASTSSWSVWTSKKHSTECIRTRLNLTLHACAAAHQRLFWECLVIKNKPPLPSNPLQARFGWLLLHYPELSICIFTHMRHVVQTTWDRLNACSMDH